MDEVNFTSSLSCESFFAIKWHHSHHSAPTTFRNNGQTFSSANGSLSLQSVATTSGADSIGTYQKTTLNWQSATGVAFVTAIRVVWLPLVLMMMKTLTLWLAVHGRGKRHCV